MPLTAVENRTARQTRSLARWLLLALASSHLLALSAQAQELYIDEQFGFALTSGVVFASKPVGSPATDMDLHLELYQPTGVGVPADRPAIVAIHGGGFSTGDRFSFTQTGICERMAKRGYTCVSIDYRLLGDAPVVGPEYATLETVLSVGGDPALAAAIAAATEDTVAAIAWLDSNAATLRIDPTHLGLTGYSAGGVLTELVAYFADDAAITLPQEPLATFNQSGSIDPIVIFVQPGSAAAYIVHGDQDTVVDIAGAYALQAQLQAAAVPHELHVLPGVGHGYDAFTEEIAPGVSVFEGLVPFFFAHVASPTIPDAVPGLGPLGLALAALGVLAGTARALRNRERC